MSLRAAMSLTAPVAFAIYALAIHAEEIKTSPPPEDAAVKGTYQTYLGRQADSGGATETKPKPKPSGGGGPAPHVKPFDGATGAQAGPNKSGWDQKNSQGGIANPEKEGDEAMLLPAVQKVRESGSRSR